MKINRASNIYTDKFYYIRAVGATVNGIQMDTGYIKVFINYENPEEYKFNKEEFEELCKVSHRPYCNGFYFGRPDSEAQVYTSSSYIRDYELIGMVEDYDEKTKILTVSQRNRFFVGEELEIMQPGKAYFKIVVDYMENENGESIEVAPHAKMIVKFKCDEPVGDGAMIRRKSN